MMVNKHARSKHELFSFGGNMNQVATSTQTKAVAHVPSTLADWGAPDVTSKDIVIPKILIMQPGSEAVLKRGAKFGEFREASTDRLIGSVEKPFEFIPFWCEKIWLVMDGTDKKEKFLRIEKVTAQNESHPFESVVGKTREVWRFVYNFYVMLPNELDGLPYIISFKGSSMRAGRSLFTQMYAINQKAGLTPASLVMRMGGSIESNNDGTFVVADVKPVRASKSAEIEAAFNWVKTIRSGAVKVDDSDLKQEAQVVGEDF